MRRFLVTFVLIILCYLLQTTLLQGIALAGVVPNLMLILVAYVGYINGRIPGIAAGMFCGFIIDCQFGSVIGIYSLIFMVVGYANGICNRMYYRDDYTMPIILVGISEVFYGIMSYVLEFLLRGRIDFSYYFGRVIFPELIYSLIFSIVLYKLMMWLYKIVERPEEETV